MESTARLERLFGVVEEIDVPGNPGGGHELVQGRPDGDVAFADRDPVLSGRPGSSG